MLRKSIQSIGSIGAGPARSSRAIRRSSRRAAILAIALALTPCLLAEESSRFADESNRENEPGTPAKSRERADDLRLYPAGVENSQNPEDIPTPPEVTRTSLRAPPGFEVTLFAAEPEIAQPISLAFDARGRLWVAEGYSYIGGKREWNSETRDRITILEDLDGDGRHDKRTVFTDTARNLSGALPGFGGVFVCSAPSLLFYPDRDRDDVPDGEPEVLLDGFDTRNVGHNIINGLIWAPDGWLWGLQGIQGESSVGPPGATASERQALTCGVWRYHPTRRVFEVVAEGTTNPWGLDFDAHGQAFMTNCVIGHLWHVVPGAHYKRMYGQDSLTHSYELIEQTADHLHWAGEKWQDSRDAKGEHGRLGGGHAHAGAMVYLGDNWPESYRGALYTNNLHGRRLNRDLLVRDGASYTAKHGEDLLRSDDPWFRGISVVYGPGGEVYVSDWCDLGECHDNDGVHRTSGRVFRVRYTEGAAWSRPDDLLETSSADLAALHTAKNEWKVRQARRILQERAAGGADLDAAIESLERLATRDENADDDDDLGDNEVIRLRALLTLHAIGRLDDARALTHTEDASEQVRGWAIRWIVDDGKVPADALSRFAELARDDPSGLVRLYLASALGRLPLEARWPIVEALVAHEEDAADRVLPLLIWYGMEPLVKTDRKRALELARSTKIPKLRTFIARRAASGE